MDRGRAQSRSGEPEAVDAVRIEALGGLRVTVGDRSLELSSQPFRCALLLYLVIERKTTRKQLIELLWPNKDPSRARRSLSQTLYELKRELQAPLVESAREVIGVADNVEVDVSQFIEAADAEEVARALDFYDGPFLSGVHLSTTVPFEHWSEKLRGKLERRYASLCLSRLEELEAAEKWNEAAKLARSWTERDYLKDEAWHHLIQALWMTGRSREALASYEWFKAALDRELEVSPIEDTTALVARIRAHIAPREPVGPPPVDADSPPRVVLGAATDNGRPRWLSRSLWLVGGVAATGLVWLTTQSRTSEAVSAVASVIAVAPMELVGDVPEELSTGVPSLVAAVLDQLDDIRTLGPIRYASVAADAGLTAKDGDVARVGRLLNASSALAGTLTLVGNEVRGEVVLRRSDSGGALAYASATAHADSASQLVDSLSLGLLRDIWRADDALPNLRVSAITSTHPQALRHYIRGEGHYLHSRWDSAQAEFRLATLADPEFALALYRYSESVTWGDAFGLTPRRDIMAEAFKHRHRLPERERRLVEIGMMDLAGRVEAVDAAVSFLDEYPDDPDGWFELGDVRVHAWKLLPNDQDRLLEPFDRAAAMEPDFSRVYIHPLQVTATNGDQRLFVDYLNRFKQTVGPDTGFEGWSDAIWGNGAEAEAGFRQAFSSTTRNRPTPLVHGFLLYGQSPPDLAVTALRRAAEEAESTGVRARLQRLLAGTYVALGRVEEVSALLAELFDERPLQTASAVVDIRAATGVAAQLEPMAEAFLRSQPQNPTAVFWLSWLQASRGDLEDARATLETLDVSDPQLMGLESATLGWLDAEDGNPERGVEQMILGLEAAGYAHAASPLLWALEQHAAELRGARELALRRLRSARADLAYLVPRMALHARLLGSTAEDLEEKERIEDCVSRLWGQADLDLTAAGGRRLR